MADTLLLHDDFTSLVPGPLPVDTSATGEYHFVDPGSAMGGWYDPIRHYAWRGTAPWMIVEDDGAHLLLQTVPAGKPVPRMLVAGQEHWTDYTVTTRLQPLKHDGFVGVCFRYHTSRKHYRAGFDTDGVVRLVVIDNEDKRILGEAPVSGETEGWQELAIEVAGDRIRVALDGTALLEAHDATFAAGRVGLIADTTCLFADVRASTSSETASAFVATRNAQERELDKLRESYPRPRLERQIDTRGFGTGRHIRFGHLRSRDRLDMVLAQNTKLTPGSDSYGTVRCLTAIDLDGTILWQFGEPTADPDAAMITADLPVQVYDIDGDGVDEVLCLKNFKLYILDGRTGKPRNVRALPLNPERENGFGRLVGDAIVIANFRGLARPSDIVVKNRYRQVWAFDSDLNELWTHPFRDWMTGHFAQPYDFDGDGRDELYIGYGLLGPDGGLRWEQRWTDHTDEIAIGRFDPDKPGVQIAIVCGEEGFNILSADGTVVHREKLGHAQRVSAARFRSDLPGVQFYVITYWGNAGIISFHDCTGRRLFDFEPCSTGNILNPVNWRGDGTELALLSPSVRYGGMLDGYGRRVVLFPDDGHPQMCGEALDLLGDGRDEIVCWDPGSIWIYTPDGPPAATPVYSPRRYPHYNASNYRAEISLPA